ncbi:hypothetical protein BH23ACT10_BH23ACT10_30410 [soil metagenome]
MDDVDDRGLANQLSDALEAVSAGDTRTQPVSTSLPTPLVEAFRALTTAGVVPSISAATTQALTRMGYNLLLRLALDEIYDEHPDARPTEHDIHAMAQRLGVALPPMSSDRVA